MRNYIDFHVHIDYYQNYREIYNYYNSKKIYALFVTNFPEVYQKSKDTFSKSKYVKLALGYHPEMLGIMPFNRREFNRHIDDTKYFGEVGLDFSKKYNKYRDEQIEIFTYICQRAKEDKKILSIHSRKAEKDVMEVLEHQGVEFAVFHWYTGSLSLLSDILDSGYYFSLNPSMLRSKRGKEIITNIPLDRILIETDEPHRTINKRIVIPGDIPVIYSKLEKSLQVDNVNESVFKS